MNERVSIDEIKKAIGGYGNDFVRATFGTTENEVDILVKKKLTLSERKAFTEAVVNMCFVDDDDGNVVYCPYLKKFSFEYHVALFFTNLELGIDVDEVESFLTNTDVMRRIVTALDEEYINELLNETSELLEYRKNEILKRSKFDDVLNSIFKLINVLNAKFDEEGGESVMKYLEENIPNFKDEITKAFQEQLEAKAINQ